MSPVRTFSYYYANRSSERSLSHEDLSDYLRGRFYISPSRLYSCIRLLPDKKGYDVPVPGDWVTIAVVAERLPIRHTRAPVAIEREEGDVPESKFNKNKNAQEPEKPSKGKKFVTMKLIDFGARSGKTSAMGGTSVIRGDAFLNLLLFEADSIEYLLRDDNGKPKKVYKGGSKGAFEAMFNLAEGDVVALLNPKLLKPYQVRSPCLLLLGSVLMFYFVFIAVKRQTPPCRQRPRSNTRIGRVYRGHWACQRPGEMCRPETRWKNLWKLV